LDAQQRVVALDDEVAARVLSERDVEPVTGAVERGHHGQLRSAADDLRVLDAWHVVNIAY
jgi:hypothetical protein